MARKISLVLGLAVIVAGCSQPLTSQEKGALVGGAIGAGTGAIIGNQAGHPGAGAVIGGAVGAVTGAVIADAARRAEHEAAYPPPPPAQVVVAAPPRVVVPTAPHMVWVPEWGVYVMDGHDIVYHQTSYYQYSNGYWWISPSYAGPWAIAATPPPTIAQLPPGRLHHHPVRRAYMAAQASPPTAPIIVQAPPTVIVAAPPPAAPAAPAPGQIFPAPRPHVYAPAQPPAVVVVQAPPVAAAPAQPTAPPVVHGAVTPAPPVAAAPVVVAPPAATPPQVATPRVVPAPAPPPAVVVPAPPQTERAPAPPAQVTLATPPAAGSPARPHMIWVAEWGVHLLEGQDVVYYNEAYFSFSGGQWSISQSHAGPWAIVPTPPPVIAKLPPGQLHSHLPRGHHCPPGLAKQGRC